MSKPQRCAQASPLCKRVVPGSALRSARGGAECAALSGMAAQTARLFRSRAAIYLILRKKTGWSEWSDSNTRPPRPERGALPGCATLRSSRAPGNPGREPPGRRPVDVAGISTAFLTPQAPSRTSAKKVCQCSTISPPAVDKSLHRFSCFTKCGPAHHVDVWKVFDRKTCARAGLEAYSAPEAQ